MINNACMVVISLFILVGNPEVDMDNNSSARSLNGDIAVGASVTTPEHRNSVRGEFLDAEKKIAFNSSLEK
jgi:hypothetical protein